MVTDEHDRDFLPRSQQLQAESLCYRDQPVLRISVQCVALLDNVTMCHTLCVALLDAFFFYSTFSLTFRIRSLSVVVAASRVLAELVDPRDFTFPDIIFLSKFCKIAKFSSI